MQHFGLTTLSDLPPLTPPTAESAGEGSGSTFIVTLPVGVPSAAVASPASPATSKSPAREKLAAGQLKGMSILIVDDDSGGRGSLRARGAGQCEARPFAAHRRAAVEHEAEVQRQLRQRRLLFASRAALPPPAPHRLWPPRRRLSKNRAAKEEVFWFCFLLKDHTTRQWSKMKSHGLASQTL